MPENETKITYDVSDALKQLDKLDGAVKKSGDTAQKGFDKGAESSALFEKALGKLSPKAVSALNSVKKFGAAFGPTGIAIGAAGAAVAAFAANLINLPSLFRDTEAEVDALNRGVQRALDLRNLISGLQDAAVNAKFTLESIAIEAERAALARQNFDVQTERIATERRLDANKKYYADLKTLADKSASERQSLEERLLRLTRGAQDRATAGLPIGQQISATVSQAGQATRAGDFDRAEQLIEQARRLSEQAGGHIFFTQQAERAEKNLAAAIKRRIDEQRRAEAAIQRRAEPVREQIATDEAAKRSLALQQREIAARQQTFLARTKENQLAQQAALFEQAAAEASRGRAAADETIVNSLGRQRSFLEQIKDELVAIRDIAFGKDVFDANAQLENFRGIAEQSLESLRTGTAQGVEEAALSLTEVEDGLKAIQAGIDSGTISKALRPEVKALEDVLDAMNKALREAAKLRGATREQFLPGGLEAGVSRQPTALIPGARPAQAAIPQPQQSTRVAAPSASTTNVNVNAQIRGGMLDADTVRQFTEIVRRELRRGTGTPT